MTIISVFGLKRGTDRCKQVAGVQVGDAGRVQDANE